MPKVEPKPLQIRALIKPKTLDEEQKRVQIILSTEKPVLMYDWDRGYIDEILLVSAANFPKQLPLLNSHSRYEISDVIGSIRDITKDDGELSGWAYFADTEEAEKGYKLVRDGHLTDVSIGYHVEKSHYAEREETISVNSKNYTASKIRSLRVVTKYNVKEGSLTPIGANDEAKVRSELSQKEAKTDMNEEEKQRAEAEVTRADIQKAEQERCAEILSVCSQHDFDATEYIRLGATLATVKSTILDNIAVRREESSVPGGHAKVIADKMDKTRHFCENSLALRLGVDAPHPKEEAVRQHTIDLIRTYLVATGVKGANRMTREQLARRAFSHSSDDFANLLANSIGKRLQKSYSEAPVTYHRWCNIVEVPDFKQVSVSRLSEGADLELIAEGGEYKEETYSDAAESYTLAKYGKVFSITWEALINDDLNAFARIARLQGSAAARKVNAVAYAILTANAALSDSVTLFHATHSNTGTTSTALAIATLAAGIAAMAKQTGMDSNSYLNLRPKTLLVPISLQMTAEELVYSNVRPGANQGHSKNLLEGKVEVVADAILDGNSTAYWYLAADPGQIDTVDIAFLEGHRQPFLDEEEGFMTDGRKYKVRMPVVAKAIDWRGLAMYTGAS